MQLLHMIVTYRQLISVFLTLESRNSFFFVTCNEVEIKIAIITHDCDIKKKILSALFFVRDDKHMQKNIAACSFGGN